MLDITDLKTGVIIDLDGTPFKVIKYQHAKLGRSGAILRTTLKNLITGANIDKTFKGDIKFIPADIKKTKAQFLYQEGENYLFMDSTSFEQFIIKREILDRNISFLTAGLEIEVIHFKDQPINVELPLKMKFKVTQADPAIKGNTATNPTKEVIIETGLKVKVPLFIKTEDTILIDTRSGSYIERTSI